MDRELILSNVKDQVRRAGLDPDDEVFWKHAGEAPTDIDLYDQITWAINETRKAKEAGRAEEEIHEETHEEAEGVSLDNALGFVKDEMTL